MNHSFLQFLWRGHQGVFPGVSITNSAGMSKLVTSVYTRQIQSQEWGCWPKGVDAKCWWLLSWKGQHYLAVLPKKNDSVCISGQLPMEHFSNFWNFTNLIKGKLYLNIALIFHVSDYGCLYFSPFMPLILWTTPWPFVHFPIDLVVFLFFISGCFSHALEKSTFLCCKPQIFLPVFLSCALVLFPV
jgi:hypothetical protein